MAVNKVSNGDVVKYVNGGTAVVSGQGVAFGSRLAIVQDDIAISGTGDVAVSGNWSLPKVGGGGVTFAFGANVFFNHSTQTSVAAAGANIVQAGKCTRAAADADTVVHVRLEEFDTDT